MDNYNLLMGLLMALLLVGGLLAGSMLFSKTVTVPGPSKEVVKEVQVPGENITVEVPIPLDRASIRDEAWNAVVSDIGDEDAFLTCDGYLYDEDEMSVSRFYDNWFYQVDDNDKYETQLDVKLRFDTKDDRACKEERTYNVFFEEGEDPVVTLVD